jgi:glycosyltransferase involved in cell wall biosynthesis
MPVIKALFNRCPQTFPLDVYSLDFMPAGALRRDGNVAGILSETMPKRLLHVVASFAPSEGGTSEGLRTLAESCAAMGPVEIACLDDPHAPHLHGLNFPVHGLGPVRGTYRYTPRWQAWLTENLARFDGVVIHGLWQHHSYGTYQVLGNKPYAVFPHGMLDPWFKHASPLKHIRKQVYWLAREYRVLRDARAVCFTTPIERDTAKATFWPQRWNPAVVSFGTLQPQGDPVAQREVFLSRFPALRGRRFFLFLSRIHRKKGCDLALEAFARAAAGEPHLDLVMAGPDPEKLRPQLEAQARQLGIAERVHWTGMLEGDEKWGAFHAGLAFVLPSHQENFGVAAVEALACGLPVLLSDKVNIWPDLLEDKSGIVNPDTAEGTFRSMQALLAMSEEQRREMIENGKTSFRKRYEMRRTALALNEIF